MKGSAKSGRLVLALACIAGSQVIQPPIALLTSPSGLLTSLDSASFVDDSSDVTRTPLGRPGGSKQRAVEIYRGLPLSFEANDGQTDQVKFFSRGSGYSLFLGPTEAVMRLRIADFRSRNAESQFAVRKLPEPQSATIDQSETVRIRLVGANASARTMGLDELETKRNYFIGNDPKKWRVNVPTYSRVKYEKVYPGIDVVYYGSQGELEHNFIVAPGADPEVIRLGFDGATDVSIDEQGDLVLKTDAGTLRHRRPVTYQEIDGARKAIASRYFISGQAIGFIVGDYDKHLPLVIAES